MPAPKPLTMCEPAQIDWSRPETPMAKGYDDIYFSVDGGMAESKAVFLDACGLPKAFEDRDYFAIGELGFGTGLNFLTTVQAFKEALTNLHRKTILHYISIEKHPLSQSEFLRASAAWPDLSDLRMALHDKWPGRVKGFHHQEFGNVRLTLIHDDANEALSQISGQMDAWYLDGFSPSKNPGMWSAEIMHKIAKLSKPGARLGTFTVARHVRDNLEAAGFTIAKKPGFGRKRDRLEGYFKGQSTSRGYESLRPIIIGSGIAGASLAHSFSRRGIKPVIIDPSDGTAASGNAAALVKPRLDLQDRPESRFFLSSYLHARQRYLDDEDCVLHRNVSHICCDEKETTRYAKLAAQAPLPQSHFKSGDEESQFELGESLVINPARAKQNFLLNADIIKGTAIRSEDGKVFDAKGNLLAEGTHVIWACGYGIRNLPQFSHLNLRYSRGQISWAEGNLKSPVTYGGYALPYEDKVLVGATHKRLDDLSPFETRLDDDHENFDKFSSAMGYELKPASKKSRSSVRVTTPNTMPLIFGGDNEWGLTGLGSRGFVFAPILGEAIVAKICGEVSPISEEVWTRFRAREKIQPGSAP